MQSFFDHGAIGDGAADDTAAVRAALAAPGPRGGTVLIPPGDFRTTETIEIPKNITLVGEGQAASRIIADHIGSALRTRSPVNMSTAMNVRLERFGIAAGLLGSEGAGFEDNCGTYLSLHDMGIVNFKWGVIFDQTECAEIDLCNIANQEPGGAAIWLTNGDTRTPGAIGQVTNRISVARCQINILPDAYGIIDEGGVAHSYRDNNYNVGGVVAMYLAGLVGCNVETCEFEGGSSGYSAILEYRTFYPSLSKGVRDGVGGCIGLKFECNPIGGTALAGLNCVSVAGLTLVANSFSGTMPAVDSLYNTAGFSALGNSCGAANPYPEYRPEDPRQWIDSLEATSKPLWVEKAAMIPQGENVAEFAHDLGGRPESVAILIGNATRVWLMDATEDTLVFKADRVAQAGGIPFTFTAMRYP